MHRLYTLKFVAFTKLSTLILITYEFNCFPAKIFDYFASVKRFSNRSFNYTFWNHTCLVTLLALWWNFLSDSGDAESHLLCFSSEIHFFHFMTGTTARCTGTTERCHFSVHGRWSVYVRFVSSEISSTFKQKGEFSGSFCHIIKFKNFNLDLEIKCFQRKVPFNWSLCQFYWKEVFISVESFSYPFNRCVSVIECKQKIFYFLICHEIFYTIT